MAAPSLLSNKKKTDLIILYSKSIRAGRRQKNQQQVISGNMFQLQALQSTT